MWLVEFSLAHRIPVACFSCHKINKISISCLNYSRKQEILLKNLLQNQQNLKARGIYSCTGIYFFKSAEFVSSVRCHFFVFRNSVEKFCVSWALSLIECVTVWALKLPAPHTDVLKPTSHKVFLRNYWNPKELAMNIWHNLFLYQKLISKFSENYGIVCTTFVSS